MVSKAWHVALLYGSRIELMSNWTKIALGFGVLYLAYRSAIKELVVGVEKVSLYGLNIEKGIAAIQLNVKIYNPLPIGVTIQKITGKVYASGVQIGLLDTTLNYYLGGEREHVLPVVVNLTAQGMGEALWKNIQTGNVNNLVIDFNGEICATKLNINMPLQLSFNWKDLV